METHPVPGMSIWLKLAIVLLMGIINLALSSPLYFLLIEVFDVATGGFINLNGIFVAILSWLLVSLAVCMLAVIFKRKLKGYYKTILGSQVAYFLLPFFLTLLLLLFSSF